MILNTYFNKKEKQSAAPAIQRIVLEPYRCVNLSTVSDNKSTDPAVVFSHSYAETSYQNVDQTAARLNLYSASGYQLLLNHNWKAVYDDGSRVPLTEIAKSGNTVQATATISMSSGTTYNLEWFNGGGNYNASSNSVYQSPDALTYSVYNEQGNQVTAEGCFSYISNNGKTSAASSTVNISSIMINNVTYPISMPTGYTFALSEAHPEMKSNISSGSTVLVAGNTYYKVNSGDVICGMVKVASKTSGYNYPVTQQYPLFLSKSENAVNHYSNADSTIMTSVTSVVYEGETWYCGDVKLPNIAFNGTTYYTGTPLVRPFDSVNISSFSNFISQNISFVPVFNANIKIEAIKKAATKILDYYYYG